LAGRLESGQLAGQFIHRQHLLVAAAFVVRERCRDRAVAGEPFIDGFGQQIAAPERVRDPLGGDQVLVVSGIHTRDSEAAGLNSDRVRATTERTPSQVRGVVSGGIEPPAFRFSGGLASTQRSIVSC